VDFSLTRNEPKEKLKKQWNNIFSIFILITMQCNVTGTLLDAGNSSLPQKCNL
jgi:hypothetical protein